MGPGKFRYYGRRLRTLQMREPYWRLRSWLRHRREKSRFQRDPQATSLGCVYRERDKWLIKGGREGLTACFRQAFEEGLPRVWWHDNTFWETFNDLYPNEAAEIIKRGEAVRTGKITLFNWKDINEGDFVSWSSTLDPTRAEDEWPATHYADIHFSHDPRRTEKDVKWCWELNRFQHLLSLGAAWRLTRDEAFAEKARQHLEKWMERVIYPLGVQWSSNLEVALRLLSLMRCHILCLDSRCWNEDFMTRFIPCLYLHCAHLERELSVHHSLSNHLLGEASALMHAAMLYRPFRNSGTWMERAVGILANVTPKLILPDGVYAEQTTGYFRFVAEFLLPLIHAAETKGISLPEVIGRRLSAGLKFVKDLTPDPATVPMIGDADNGLAIGWNISDFWDFSPLLATGAVMFNEPWLGHGLERFPAESFLELGPAGLEAFNVQSGSRSDRERRLNIHCGSTDDLCSFPYGGYQVSRDSLFNLIFDVGPLGIYPGFGHGHADGLSFLIHYKTRPAVVDTGTFVYNGSRSWRDYFRSTAAHNTISIDGRSQSTPADTFLWTDSLRISFARPKMGNRWRLLQGAIEWPRIIHYRYIIHAMDQGIVVLDHIRGTGNHMLEWSMHWAPTWNLQQTGNGVFAATGEPGALEVLFLCPEDTRNVVLCGSMGPVGGWYSRAYGQKEPAPTLKGTAHTTLPASFLMAIRPKGQYLQIPGEVLELTFPMDILDLILSEEFTWFGRPTV